MSTQENPPNVQDALAGDFPDAAPPPGYRNLWVPLIVVPALIVMVLVLVWVLFGSLAGSEKSPAENVQRMVSGTSNEREQAAVLLVNQIGGYLEATSQGREPEWELDTTFLPGVSRAWEETDPGDVELRFVLAFVQFQLGEEGGLDRLLELLSADEEQDPHAAVRFLVLRTLGVLGGVLDGPARARAQAALLPFLESADPGLRHVAATALRSFPGEASVAGLRATLSDAALDVRGSAAISLAHLGDASGGEVLRELLDPSAYAAEHAAAPARWAKAELISQSRIQAVQALASLGRSEDRATLESLANDEGDLNVRAAALRALEDAPQ